jgi:hypothetical protein
MASSHNAVFNVTHPAPKQENLVLNLVCNIALPSLILVRFSKPEHLGPALGLVIALLFPLGYGIWDFARRRQTNFISVIGFVSVLLTGGLGLMKMDGFWFAVKEAAVPTIIGLAVLASMRSKRPLVRQFLLNESVMDLPRVDAALETRGNKPAFDRLLQNSSYLLALSFLVSAVLNYGLARYLLRSPSGSPEFNEELGRMNLLSWPVIVIPSMIMMMFALWRLIGGIRRLTGLAFEDIFRAEAPKK